MKIIPFSPAPDAEARKSCGKPSLPRGDDFQKHLESAGQKLRARDKIGLENLIANETAPPGDLSQAARLLAGVIAELGLKSSSELSRIHKLDDLLYY